MWDAPSDRDYADEVYTEGRAEYCVPCADCRSPVEADPRTYSVFTTYRCPSCQAAKEKEMYLVASRDPRRA